jgi:hypothetical protein
VISIFIADASVDVPLPEAIDHAVTSPADYVAGYDLITKAIHSNRDLSVLVTDKGVGRWFTVMARKYGNDQIRVENLTPKSLFQSQTGIKEIPNKVSDDQIIKSGLLELKIPAPPNTSFDDYLLDVFFGKFLTLPNGLRRVDEILTDYEPEQWLEAMQRPLVRDIFRNRILSLRNEFRDQEKKADLKLLEWIDISPQIYIQNLFALKVVKNYPPGIGKRVFGAIYSDLMKLNLDLRKVPFNISGNEKTITEIRLYLEQLTTTLDANLLSSLIDQVSGMLEIEFDAIQQVLATGKTEITQQDIKKIRNRFSSLVTAPRIAQALSDLDMIIPREPPVEPDPAWDAENWISWATQEYLPYRYWLENTGQLNDEIGEIANKYSEWLFQNYGSLLYHSEHMVWKGLLNLKDEIKSFSGPVLVVVVDNFNTKFYPDLRVEMQQQGFYEQQMRYCFSLIPSCTEVSKKALITGHYAPFQETGYQKQVEGVWEKRLGKKVKYLPNISNLRLLSQQDHDVYFLNYLPLDITLHQNENQIGISHSHSIRNYLHLLAQDIRAFAQRLGVERNLMIVIVSDHGSTRIPRGTVNVIQKKYYQDRTEDGHHRYIALSDQETEKLQENIKYDCYLIKKEAFDLPKNYLVARRLYRFLPTDDHAYIHGGLTPEETLVPLAIYQPATITPKPLSIIPLDGTKIYVGTKVNLRLEITNINNYPCEQVTIEFNDPNMIADATNILEIAQLNRVVLDISARCPRTAVATARKLNTKISFQFLGQPWEFQTSLPIEIVEPAKAKFDLDNL